MKERDKWRKEKEGGNGNGREDQPKAKQSATIAYIEEDAAWMAECPSDSDFDTEDDWDERILFSRDEMIPRK